MCVESQVVELPDLGLSLVLVVAQAAFLEQVPLGLSAGNSWVSVAEAHLLAAIVYASECQRLVVVQTSEAATEGSLAFAGETVTK